MAVVLSPRYQVVIPQAAREQLKLKSGMRVQVFVYEDRIEFIPERSPRELRGLLRGMDTTLEREEDRV